MNLRYSLIASLAALSLLTGCGGNDHTSTMRQLERLDSLVYHQGEREALLLLQEMNTSHFSKEEKSYHSLLLTMAQYKNYLAFTSDSVINDVVDHYKKSADKVKCLKSLIAQGCVNEYIGNLDKAVDSYHHAEVMPLITDSSLIAYAKMRLANLYNAQYIGAETIVVNKYNEAAQLFHALGDEHYELICLTEIGALYRGITSKHDSVPIIFDRALELAKHDKDPFFLFQCNYLLSEFYTLKKEDYRKGVDYGIKAINIAGDQIEHPRAHYNTALAYVNLGLKDSALYYMRHAPVMTTLKDTASYYWTMTNIAKHDHNWEDYTRFYDKSNSLSDSVLMAGLNHRLLAVEKKYDVQLAELNQVKNESRLRGTLLALAGVIIAALALLLGLLRYRNRLKVMQNEAEMLKVDLDASLASLKQMQATIGNYENELQVAQAELKGNETAIAQLEAKKVQSDEMRTIVDGQIKIVHELLENSYRYDGNTFARKFNELMTMPEAGGDNASYWDNLQQLVNDLYNNVLIAAQETADGTLRDDEVNYLALHCCGYSRTVIMICMKYKSLGTVSNKKVQIARKLHVTTLDDFTKPYITLAPHN